MWNKTDLTCVDVPKSAEKDLWSTLVPPDSEVIAGGMHVVRTISKTSFPMTFVDFERGAAGYMIGGITGYPLHEIIAIDILFVQLDTDANGLLNQQEFKNLPVLLGDAEVEANKRRAAEEGRMLAEARRLWENSSAARKLSDSPLAYQEGMYLNDLLMPNPENEPKVCKAENGRVYCPLDMTCKPPNDCSTCGWKTAVDREQSLCVQPDAEACKKDGGKMYCPTDMTCHPPGDCRNCPSMTITDHAQHKCLEPWWEKEPRSTWTSWICKHRKKVGMKCTYDMDCLFGTRRCLPTSSGSEPTCQSMQPYNPEHTCASDLDCPHVGYYCPSDPTFGEDPYFIKFCRKQFAAGQKCDEDRECEPGTVCNDVERPKTCRAYYSVPNCPSSSGGRNCQSPGPEGNCCAKDPNLCISGWTDKYDQCAVSAQSKAVGRSCGRDEDCLTTDQTNKTGECTCKVWWDGGEPKYCLPVSGDLENSGEKMRDWLWFKKMKCGTFWSDEECVSEFGDDAKEKLQEVKCELQCLSNPAGPNLPPRACKSLLEQEKYMDQCEMFGGHDSKCKPPR
jgi:hypothetical protein